MKPYFLLALLFACSFLGLSTTTQAQTTPSKTDSLITRATIKDNTIFWNQNRLVRHSQGNLEAIDEPVKYPNGTSISPEGKVRLANGKTYTLSMKQAINPQGNIVLVADDLFTYNAIQEQERQVAGDTETKIVVINGQISSIKESGKTNATPTGMQKKVELTRQLVDLLEQRSKLLEAKLAATEKDKTAAQVKGLNARIASVERDLQRLGAQQ
ncbi:hypothetical protein TH61_04265 [Rufibacter sp. DG15C]|uniref:DUF6799 domain-containing protein n=1 Tax=Rufibacter sp. DG15C TaxID=1379909 RepID=UPI00078D9BC8|nr:DUF6799 domain-containing protein [Rufibacter sp. DG15C]AMM50546.1 hypothetical protein TH61_04265 [Rufibacter sp. DG15C]